MTTSDAQIDFIKKLKTIYDDREAENISDWVFENVTGMKRWERRSNQNKDLKENELEKLQKYSEELLQHKPVQYVLNESWFYKMKFFVDENVLIPRPETEELVEWIVNDINSGNLRSSKTINILEIGSGSGCISIALKKELNNVNVSAIEISEKALDVSKKNSSDLKAKVDFSQIDFLNETQWDQLFRYDIIVSNPPYIAVKERETLARNVADFEPSVALFVENENPFIFYEKIAQFSKNHLNAKGRIYMEIHETQSENVKKILEKEGLAIAIKQDIYGKERMIRGIKTNG